MLELTYPIRLRATKTNTFFTHLVCSACGHVYSKGHVLTVCQQPGCLQPLLAVYDTRRRLNRKYLRHRPASMWRYREMLPMVSDANIVSLGEGFTPMLKATGLSKKSGMFSLFIKDESLNPTGSFKARGLSMAVSRAKELGITSCVIPTAGNAGGAMSAYCAKAGIAAHVFMPTATPDVFKQECRFFGAQLTLVDGSIYDCGQLVRQQASIHGWFDVSTTKEPYRIEGKKTLGYEIAEQLGWILPEVIVYPTGGGTGLIGMWKAFDEMEQLGWIGSQRPRMVAVQSANCAPVVKAFESGATQMTLYPDSFTVANGLRVPKPYADSLILRVLKESKGSAISIEDEAIIGAVKEIAREEGLLVSPEGGAIYQAAKQLLQTGWIQPEERVVLVNTGSGYKYLENLK
ncbi:threonine synthase [Rhodocytophaga aerolata]|uniref:Threonine synthase n=1 Tax=Rhodocytophaga aerolata TaxID=455078 RepID=A0ABT8RJ89_9BACT|nr:threonine synthase [Rhodocytophaga aerolata]MDO1450940.1 threonine synthase [Rhodocytophaga aerolata]